MPSTPYDDQLVYSQMLFQQDLANARAAFEAGGDVSGQPSRQAAYDRAVREAEIRHTRGET
jgi:hypothetical protein